MIHFYRTRDLFSKIYSAIVYGFHIKLFVHQQVLPSRTPPIYFLRNG